MANQSTQRSRKRRLAIYENANVHTKVKKMDKERKALERFVAKEKATPRQRRTQSLKETLLRKQKYRELKKKEKEKKEKDGRESQDKMETQKRIIKPRGRSDTRRIR